MQSRHSVSFSQLQSIIAVGQAFMGIWPILLNIQTLLHTV